MKKALSFLMLTATLAVPAVVAFVTTQSKELLADDLVVGADGYVEMTKNAFTDPSLAETAGVFEESNATYWPTYAGYHGEDGDSFNYPFYALDKFFCGERNEGWTGDLQLKSWTQREQYIYFTWGGATNSNDQVYLEFNYGPYHATHLNDTSMGNPMLLRYFKIPDEQYDLLDKVNGFEMSITLHDGRTGDYGFHNFGYLHVDQTKEQVADAMRLYLNSMSKDKRASQIRIRKEILNHYFGNEYLRDVFYSPVEDIDENFENNDAFLNHWYFDYNYFNGANWDLHFDRAIGTDEVRPADTFMPFNKTGNGFFRGWFENDSLGGFVNGDGSRYRFVSRPFVLSGTGLVSIKMAGTASLHVIDPATRQDLAWADVTTFNTAGSWDDLSVSDFNTVTMIRHVVNLEAYLGKTIQLAIADVETGGWSALYADELITNYASNPGFKIDAFNHNESNVFKTDKYINSTIHNGENNSTGLKYVAESDMNKANNNEIINHQDNSPAKAAYDFLNNNYYLNKNDNEQRLTILNAYYALSSAAQAIVNSSSNVQSLNETPLTVGEKIVSLLGEDEVFTVSFSANGGTGSIASLDLVEHTLIDLPNCSFTAPAGKKFKEWNTNADGSGVSKAEGNQIEVLEDVTWYAIWENTAQTDVENLKTTSALSYAYTKVSEDNYSFTSAKITFGGSVSVSLWNKLDEESEHHIEGFGVLVADTATLGENALTPETAAHDMFISVETKSTPTLSADESAYIWSLRLNLGNATENYDDAVTAIAYVKVNGNYIYLQQSEQSVVSLANDYIENRGYSAKDFEGSLGALANLGQ